MVWETELSAGCCEVCTMGRRKRRNAGLVRRIGHSVGRTGIAGA